MGEEIKLRTTKKKGKHILNEEWSSHFPQSILEVPAFLKKQRQDRRKSEPAEGAQAHR